MRRLQSITIAAAAYPVDPVASFLAWQDKAARWVADGAASGAELLVFPEYGAIEIAHAAGPAIAANLQSTLQAVADAAPQMIATYAELARRHRVHILCPSGPRRGEDGRFRNVATLVTPDGHVGDQAKRIMTPFEVDWGVVGGDALRVFDTALGRIGIAICYDSEFPLLVRALTEAGAEIVLIPSCTERISGHHRIRTAALARALESTVVTVQSPTVGDAPWSPAVDRNAGAAGVFVPSEHRLSDTGILAEGRMNAPGWVAATVDLAALRALKASGEMRNDADWRSQPGAGSLDRLVEIVTLQGPSSDQRRA